MKCWCNNDNGLSNTLHLYSEFRGYVLDVNGEYIMTNVLGVKWVTTGEKNVTSTLLSSIILLCASVLLVLLVLLSSRATPVCARCKEAIISYFAMKCITILEILIFCFCRGSLKIFALKAHCCFVCVICFWWRVFWYFLIS